MSFVVLPPEGSFSSNIGKSLGQGLGIGLGGQLNQMFERRENRKFASNLAKSLMSSGELSADQQESFSDMLSNLKPQEQIMALQNLNKARMASREAEILQGYLNPQMQPQMQPEMGAPMGNQVPEQAQQAPQQAPAKGLMIEDIEITPEELQSLRRTKAIPPIGNLTEISKQQREDLKENRKEIGEFAQKYADVKALRDNVERFKKAQTLINRMDTGRFRKALLAAAEGKPFQELLKTPDEQKLFSLLRPALQTKEIGGANPSTREVLIAMEALPGLLKSKEANKYIMKNLLNQAEVDYKKGMLIQNLRKINPEADPAVFKELVDRKVAKPKTSEKIRVLFNDEIVEIPEDKLNEALEMGAQEL